VAIGCGEHTYPEAHRVEHRVVLREQLLDKAVHAIELHRGPVGFARPLDAHAVQTTMPIVGFLHSGSLSGRETQVAAFREGLTDSGYIIRSVRRMPRKRRLVRLV
jgi:hypothetical protein